MEAGLDGVSGAAGRLRIGMMWLDATLRLRGFDQPAAGAFGLALHRLEINAPVPEMAALPAAFRIWLSRAAMDMRHPQRFESERVLAGIQPAMGGGWSVWVMDRSSLAQDDSVLDEIIAAIPSPVFYKDTEGRYLGCNPAFERYVGVARHELIGRTVRDIAPQDLAEVYEDADRLLTNDDQAQVYEAEVGYADGSRRDVQFHKAVFRDRSGKAAGIVGVMLDVTQQKRLERELRLAASVFDNAAEAITITDSTPRILKVNRAFKEITGYSELDVLGKNPSVLSSGRQGDGFYQKMWQRLQTDGVWFGEIINRRKNGEEYPEYLSISAVRDGGGEVSHYIGIFTDLSNEKNAQEQIEQLSLYDGLTELPNRTLLTDRLRQAILSAERRRQYCAVLLVGVEGLRQVNDSLGYEVGDHALQQIGERLHSVVRSGDTLGRYLGDQFVIVLADLGDAADAAVVANHLLEAMEGPFHLADKTVAMGASVGISVYPKDGASAQALLRAADVAMHHAKGEGRNLYQFFSEDQEGASLERMMLQNNLRQALDRKEFELHFQPLINGEQRIVSAEALIRWIHPDLGIISPMRFIPLAEETGQIIAIGHWVLVTACRQARLWQDAGLTIPVAVNVSARQFRQRDFVEQVRAVLDETGLPADGLELELTESMVMHDPERAVVALRALRAMGVRVSIDDFGTGYSSLAYLKRFEIDKLKIDRSLVMDLPHEPNDVAIAEAVLAMGKSLRLKVIAEGVETVEQLDFFKTRSVDGIQGFYFSPPVTADVMTALLREQQAA